MINHLVIVPNLPDQTRHLVLIRARGGDRLELPSKPDSGGHSKIPAFVRSAGGRE